MVPDNRSSLRRDSATKSVSSLDEAALQRERLAAMARGNITRYNQLVDEHKALLEETRRESVPTENSV